MEDNIESGYEILIKLSRVGLGDKIFNGGDIKLWKKVWLFVYLEGLEGWFREYCEVWFNLRILDIVIIFSYI